MSAEWDGIAFGYFRPFDTNGPKLPLVMLFVAAVQRSLKLNESTK